MMITAQFNTPYGISGNCIVIVGGDLDTIHQRGTIVLRGYLSEAALLSGADAVPGCEQTIECRGNSREQHTSGVWRRLKYSDLDLSEAQLEAVLIEGDGQHGAGKLLFGNEIVSLEQD